MFAKKKKYFLIIENTKDIDLRNIKVRNKFSIIYRNHKNQENYNNLIEFSQNCRSKNIKFYVANDLTLATRIRSNGIYLSAFNSSLKCLRLKSQNFEIIGSAHNLREIKVKILQGCSSILFSKLFFVSYDNKSSFLGIVKFNNYLKVFHNLIPLGGINSKNLNNLRNVNCYGFALLSEVKKKPANIINRLF